MGTAMVLGTALMCLSLNIYFEARSDHIPGQYAVALVTMNRAGGDQKEVCREVLKPKQFSWTTDKIKRVKGRYFLRAKMLPREREAWKLAKIIAKRVLQGKIADFTMGATHYHTPAVNPIWRYAMAKRQRIGQHIFYRVA